MKKYLTTLLTTTLLVTGLHASAASKVETWETNEGAEVYFLQAPEIPMIDLIVALDAGSFREGDQYGLAGMTASMMSKGTKTLNEEDFLIKLDDLQSSIGASASTNHTTLSLRSLTKESLLIPSLALFYDVIENATFDEAIFERERAQVIDGQKAILDNPSAIASELYYQALYPNSVLGGTSEMLQASLKEMSLVDLNHFRETFYNANNAKIIFVGDISRPDAEKIAQQVSALLGPGKALPALAEKRPDDNPVRIEQAYNSPQTQVILGQPAIDRFDEDYLPLIVGNHLLGGSGLTSILMTTIREKDGLTYGIYSGFVPSFVAGPFTIRFSTKNESVDEAIEKTKAVVADFIKVAPDNDALERSKNNFLGSLVLDLDSNAKLAGSILQLATYGLPLDYYETLPEKVRAITPEEIQKAFMRHVNPDTMTTVIVGGYVQPEEKQ